MDTNVLPKVPNVILGLELELASEKLAKRNNRAFSNTGFGATTGGQAITATFLDRVVPCVIAELRDNPQRSRSSSHKRQLEQVIRGLDPAVIALVCIQGALHSVGHEETLRDTYLRIGRMLSVECWGAELTTVSKTRAARIAKAVTTANCRIEQRIAAAQILAAKPELKRDRKGRALKDKDGADIVKTPGFKMKHWSRPEMIHAGHWCVQLLLDAMPDVFCLVDGRNGEKELTLSPNGLAKAEQAVRQTVVQNPVYQPRTERPSDWAEFSKDIAEDEHTQREEPLLRTWHKDLISAAKHAIRTGTAAPALKALNALQSVPFQINTWIMDIIRQCYDQNIKVEGLPAIQDLKLPERLKDEEFAALDMDARAVRSDEIKGLKRINRSLIGARLMFAQDMAVAGRMAQHDRFHVPMNMDWRGRVYGLSHFNFQREDRVRALFLFANGEPIGEEGIYWLKIHVANCGDFGKVSKRPMAERIQWVDDHIEEIAKVVQWPMGRAHQWWRDADCPFLFLAAARELVAALEEGPHYVTTVPVSFDGSCSGLQHLAAATRAPEGRYVNLTDNEVPEDVYTLVAERAKSAIEEDTEYPELRKQCLDYGITRSLVKRNTMTFCYSSKDYGMGQQHLEDTMRPLKTKVLKKEIESHPFGEDEGYAASKYLAKHVHASIEDLVPLPAAAMGFLQGCARALAHEGKPLRWTSPAGLPWINRYHEPVTERIKLYLNDNGFKTRLDMKVATGDQKEISKEKAASGVAPNFVHANDASHLLLTVVACVSERIIDIATVHDSFGCLASRAGRFNQIIREQFLKMYTDHDVLAELLASAMADLTPANHSKLPELPTRGTLNLEEILHAKYAFA